MFLDRQEETITSSHLTKAELKQIYRRYRHPNINSLYMLLTNTGIKIDIKIIE
jgi:hypothetical protein